MAVVQFFINPIFSHINPNIPLIDELVKRGVSVIFYSLPQYRTLLENHKVQYYAYQNYGRMFDWGKEKRCESFAQQYEYLIQVYGRNFSPEFIQLKEWVSDEMERVKPDIVIYDYFDAYWAKLAAGRHSVPAIATVCTFAITSGIAEIAPEDCLQYVLRINDPSLIKSPEKSRSLLRKLSKQIGKIFHTEDFPILDYGNSSYLNLIHTSEVFHPYRSAFDNTFYFCGYQVNQTEEEDKIQLEDIIGKTVVYISLGLTELNNAESFYQTCMDAFADSRYQVIMATGDRLEIGRLSTIPDNFIVHKRVNQRWILQFADVFLTHCGFNSAQEALFFGVPLCLLPWQADEFAVAHQLESLGAGIRIDRRSCNASDLRRAVEELLSNPQYAEASKSIGNSLMKRGAISSAADKIMQFIDNPGRDKTG